MNRPFRTVLLSGTLVAGLGLAQDTSQTQPGQTQGMQTMGDQNMLGELCEVYQGLGQLIIRLEGQGMASGMGAMPTGTMTTETSTTGTTTTGTTGSSTTGSTTTGSTTGTPAGEPVGATDTGTWTQEQRDALTRSRSDLEALRSTIEADELDDATRQEVTRIREGLRTDLEGAGDMDRATAEGLEALFEQLEQQASEGQTDQYRATYGSILGLLDASAGTDQMSGRTTGRTTGQQTAQQPGQAGMGQAGMGQQAQGMMRSAEDICRELGTQGMMDAQESMMSEMRERQSQALQTAFADLEALRERVEAGDADTAQAVESIRQGLRESFTGSSDMDRSSWEETDLMLGELTDQLREGREEYRATYDGVMTRLGTTSQQMRDSAGQPLGTTPSDTTTDDATTDDATTDDATTDEETDEDDD